MCASFSRCVVRGNVECYLVGGVQVPSSGEYRCIGWGGGGNKLRRVYTWLCWLWSCGAGT